MRISSIFGIAIVAINLGGCVNPHMTKEQDEAWESSANGLVIGSMFSVSHGGFKPTMVSMGLLSQDGERAGRPVLESHLADKYEDFPVADDAHGRLFVLELPPGIYHFSDYIVAANFTYRLSGVPRSAFVVKPGQPVYVGSYLFSTNIGWQKTILGWEASITGADVRVLDNYDKDIKIFRKKYAKIEAGNIPKSILWRLGPFEKERHPIQFNFVPIIIN